MQASSKKVTDDNSEILRLVGEGLGRRGKKKLAGGVRSKETPKECLHPAALN